MQEGYVDLRKTSHKQLKNAERANKFAWRGRAADVLIVESETLSSFIFPRLNILSILHASKSRVVKNNIN